MSDFSIPKEDTNYLDTRSNFPCVDIVLAPDSLFQITISEKNQSNKNRCERFSRNYRRRKVSLYFIVLEEHRFEDYTALNYQNKQRKVSQKVSKSVKILEQCVLGVPLKLKKGEQFEAQGIRKEQQAERTLQKTERTLQQTERTLEQTERTLQQTKMICNSPRQGKGGRN